MTEILKSTTMKSTQIKMITLNIHKGFSLSNRQFTLDKIKENIKNIGADIVCLQEIVGAHVDFAPKPQFEVLADQIWDHVVYGKNAIYSNGHHGNAILSHYPFEKYTNVNISNHRYEQRGILYGVIQLPHTKKIKLHILTLHLDLTSWGRRQQINKLCAFIKNSVPENEPLIVCGDFNDWTTTISQKLKNEIQLDDAFFSNYGFHARTFPSTFPFLKLDRIYFRNLLIKNISVLDQAPWRKLSDHLALYGEFEIE